ncbi:hypothetical protein BY458DRAFT_500226 [Sporodiniella umbellata]|nr:hypothetical protein BY458DRAFT_500226 [Sporodiniella umbellata]
MSFLFFFSQIHMPFFLFCFVFPCLKGEGRWKEQTVRVSTSDKPDSFSLTRLCPNQSFPYREIDRSTLKSNRHFKRGRRESHDINSE